jgi:hypothetical protein
MTISEHAEVFGGQPVHDYTPGEPGPVGCVYRLALEYDDSRGDFAELLDEFLTEHGGPDLTTLVIGAWDYEDMLESAASVVEPLVGAKDRMPDLKALFFGDITYEQCEMSWIQHGDISPLLPAFPRLEEFRIRGTTSLSFGAIRHPNIRSFAIESGGLHEGLLQEVWAAELPRLERLELWLGDEYYGGINTIEPLAPLLSGKLFPNLKSLGLCNSRIQDEVAKVVAASPILDRLEELDLSLGNLKDEGAKALIASSAVKKLKRLNLQHHFISDEVAA